MKAVLQSYGSGELEVAELPAPALQPGGVLVRNAVSLISAGTEKLMVDLAQKSLLGKARDRPDLVRRVFDKLRRDGLMATLETVRSRLDNPIPLGYSCAGTVIEVGEGVNDVKPGDRVACAGAGYANHAEVVFVPRNLVVPLPEGVPFEAACFTTVGAIALQGLRLAEIELGETVAVIGLGLVGLLAAQLAKASGARVVGMDTNPARCALARELGIDDAVAIAHALGERCRTLTSGHGADKVIVAASTKSSEPIALAGEVARTRGIVSVVGAVGMDVPRPPYYDKELTLRVSRSYGAGRYDPEYEEKGRDYPIGYVRWTENRNMEAFVAQLAAGTVRTEPLVSHRFAIAEADRAYNLLAGKSKEPYLGLLLTYPETGPTPDAGTRRLDLTPEVTQGSATSTGKTTLRFGALGAGLFATGTLLPTLAKIDGVTLDGLVTATGIKARHAARKFGFAFATTDEAEVLGAEGIDAVMIATRHHLHARQALAALEAGQHVFVEKPLCLNEDELEMLVAAHRASQESPPRSHPPRLMVGFNRRFAPLAVELRQHFAQVDEPLALHYRINAGQIPLDHWTQDPDQGGGRIVGEVCHFVDFAVFLTGARPVAVNARALPNGGTYRDDNLVATLTLADGSLATITYLANGSNALAKERIEVSGGGASAVLDNFRRLELMRGSRRRVIKGGLRQDKGHAAQLAAFVRSLRQGDPTPIPFEEIVAVTRATFDIRRRLRQGVDAERSSPPSPESLPQD